MHKPFLKFAGGKVKLAKQIISQLDLTKSTYVEPFMGSGAVFLNTNYANYILADANKDLIGLYTTLQQQGLSFIEQCAKLFTPENNTADAYYAFRDQFNASTDILERAKLFVYLNRHCFNGLCRYNASGGFNVPFGKYTKVYFPQKEMEFFWKKSQSVKFICADFRKTLLRLPKDSAVYCDPPYLPLTDTANFTKYTVKDFTLKDQKDLAKLLLKMSRRGISCVATNHDVPLARKIYKKFDYYQMPVYRSISAAGANRIKTGELLIKATGK